VISKVISKYLDKEDARSLQIQLQEAGINSIVKRHGLPIFFGGIINYQVMIDPKDNEPATSVLQNFIERSKIKLAELTKALTVKCPGCGSTKVVIEQKNSLLKKIIYYGVTIHRCNECHGKWFT